MFMGEGQASGIDTAKLINYREHMRRGLFVIVFLVFGLGLWSVLTKIQGAVIAPGIFIVEGKPKVIQHLDGGIVEQVHVKNGDHVKAGDLLLSLNTTVVGATLNKLTHQDYATHAQIARLESERKGLAQIIWPKVIINNQSHSTVKTVMADQQELFRARRALYIDRQNQINASINQSLAEINGTQSTLNARGYQLRSLEAELQRLTPLLKSNAISTQRVASVEREVSQLRGEIDSLYANIRRLQEQTSEQRSQLGQLEKDRQEQILTALNEQQILARDVSEQMTAASDRDTRSDIRAPSDGVVHKLQFTTIKGVIPPGQEIMQIVPVNEDLVVEARIQPQDIDQIRQDQTAVVTLSAFHQAKAPQLNGAVITVSPDLLTDEYTGAPYYNVLIGLPQTELTKIDHLQIVPGMPADSFIQTQKASVMSYLLKPVQNALSKTFREE